MHKETFPEAPEEAPLQREGPVNMASMVEGELLSLSQEELREKLQESEALVSEVFAKAGITPDHYTPELLAHWASIDANMLGKLPTEHLQPNQKLELAVHLWGVTGMKSASWYEPERSMGHNTQLAKFVLSEAFRKTLEKKIVLEGGTNEHLEEMRAEALIDMMRHDPEEAKALMEQCRTHGMSDVVDTAERKLLHRNVPQTQRVRPCEKNEAPEVILQALEEQDQGADRYEAYKERMRKLRQRRHERDMFSFGEETAVHDDEEEEMIVPAAHRVSVDLTNKHDDFHIMKQLKHWSPNYMVAAVRYARAHPESLFWTATADEDNPDEQPKIYDETDAFINNLLSNAERLPSEEIPSEVIEYIVEKLENPAWTDRAYLHPWEWLRNSANPRVALKKYLAKGSEMEAVRRVLAKTEKKQSAHDSTTKNVFFARDARATKALANWLQNHDPHDIRSRKAFDAALHEIIAHAQTCVDEGADLPRMEIETSHEHSKGWHTCEWEKATGIGLTLLRLCQKSLPAADALVLCREYSGYDNTWMEDPFMREIVSEHEDATEQGWMVLEATHELPAAERGMLLVAQKHLFLKTFQSDLPRACEFIRKQILEPMLKDDEVMRMGRVGFCSCLEILATFDREEAKTILDKAAGTPSFQQALQDAMKWPWDARRMFPSLIRVAYADLCYPTPVQRPYLEIAEQNGKALPSPLALMLHFEAKGGTPWGARPVPLLNPSAVEEAWFRIVRDQAYPEPKSPPGEGASKNKQLNDERSYRERRDHLLEKKGKASNETEQDPDAAEMPQASDVNEHPKTVATLSKELTGDNRYVVTKICDHFNSRWLAHEPSKREANMDLREFMQREVTDGETVTMHVRMNHGAVIPMPMTASVASLQTSEGKVRWAGHWSKRLDSPHSAADMEICYRAGEARIPSRCTLAEVKKRLPTSLLKHLEDLSRFSDLPPKLQELLQSIDVDAIPLSQVIARAQTAVHEYYEYCFINQHPAYAQKYQELLLNMPYTSKRNEYLNFIHSLREEHEDILGRGICGQLATVLEASLRALGVPTYFATGYMATGKTITTNDGHAWVITPMLDEHGQLFMKPVEATGGPIDVRSAMRAQLEKENTEPGANPPEPSKPQTPIEPLDEGLETSRRMFSEALGRDLSVEDMRSAAAMVRSTVHTQAGRIVEISDEEALTPRGYLVTPRYALGLEREMNAEANDVSEGTRALLSFLLEKSREEYANMEACWKEDQTDAS